MTIAQLGFKILNPTINTLLRSPLHFIVSKRLMAIEYTGIKSGKKFSVPVSYFNKNDCIYCLTDGKWWNNFKTDKQVNLILNKKAMSAYGVVVLNNAEYLDVLSSLIDKFPSDARYYGVKLGRDDKPLPGEIEKSMTTNKMIKFSNIG